MLICIGQRSHPQQFKADPCLMGFDHLFAVDKDSSPSQFGNCYIWDDFTKCHWKRPLVKKLLVYCHFIFVPFALGAHSWRMPVWWRNGEKKQKITRLPQDRRHWNSNPASWTLWRLSTTSGKSNGSSAKAHETAKQNKHTRENMIKIKWNVQCGLLLQSIYITKLTMAKKKSWDPLYQRERK